MVRTVEISWSKGMNNGPKLKSLEELSKRLAQAKACGYKQLGGGDGNEKQGDENL